MRLSFNFFLVTAVLTANSVQCADIVAVTDKTTYNVGDDVKIRLNADTDATASIRYAGENSPAVAGIPISGTDYRRFWKVPWEARTGRYEVDVTRSGGNSVRGAISFAVHRQLAKVISMELDKTFYTSGDPVNPRIVVRNFSNRQLDHLQVEFEAYTFPWIDPPADARPTWKTIVAGSLSLPPGGQRELRTEKAAVVQAGKEPVDIYFSVVIRDNRRPDEIYDLASVPAAFTVPPNTEFPKEYPRLYLYQRLYDVPKSEAYRQFYPPEFISDVITFNTSHTMFPTGIGPALPYEVKPPRGADLDAHWRRASINTRVLDAGGRALKSDTVHGTIPGTHAVTLKPMDPGRYILEVSVQLPGEITIARNRLEFSVNVLPKSILVFCAHQDDDTAHPGIIRAAVENNIPIHVVYFTSGGGNGCDRYYMHGCDPARAMDFGEVRMDEARASLGHLGVPRENIFFLGLPDGGLGQVWSRHLKADDPYLSELLATDHSPFRDAAIPNLPYARDAALAAAKEFIVRYQPEMIITGHPDERHVDHRTNNWIVVKAMQALLREGKLSHDTQLIVDISYGESRRKHAPYKYEKHTLYVSGEVARMGQEALWYYQSQDGNHQQANIIEYNKLPREEPYLHARILDWQDHEGWNEQE